MRVRVLLTNGTRTVDLFWLSHDGRDVYYGTPGTPEHFSYHHSGARHLTRADGREIFEPHVPLQEIRGQFHLISIGFNPGIVMAPGVSEYQGGKADAVAFLDTRSMPDNRPVNAIIGLLEPYRVDGLPLTPEIPVKYGLLVTSVTPWVYVFTTWDD